MQQGLNESSLSGDLKMVDVELMVLSMPSDGMPDWVKEQFLSDTPNDDINKLTFFYHQGADAVVLNSSHQNADLYELLVTAYLGTEEDARESLKREIPTDSIRTALDLMDYIIKEREKKYGRCKMRDSGDAH